MISMSSFKEFSLFLKQLSSIHLLNEFLKLSEIFYSFIPTNVCCPPAIPGFGDLTISKKTVFLHPRFYPKVVSKRKLTQINQNISDHHKCSQGNKNKHGNGIENDQGQMRSRKTSPEESFELGPKVNQN